jgi:4-hydroxy-tetrahydrodipicolinate synthase
MDTASRAPFGPVLTAVITPFDSDGAVDYAAFWKLVRHLLATGSDGVVVSGTTGESPTLSNAEKIALYKAAVDAAGDRGLVIAGTGTYNTAESVEMSEKAAAAGVHGLMAVTPYYSKPPQSGIIRHFSAIADSTDLPVLLYNIPGRTSRLVAVDTLVELAAHPRIVAVKDAVDDITYTRREIEALPNDFAVYSGSDSMTRDIVEAGGVGVVSVASHLVGPLVRRLVEAAASGDEATSRKLHDGLSPLFEALFAEPNPMPLKAAMSKVWEDVGEPRLPLVPASEETLGMVVDAMEAASEL